MNTGSQRKTVERPKVIFMVSFMNRAGAQRAAHRMAYGFQCRGWDTELWFLYKVSDDTFSDVPVRVFHQSDSPSYWTYLVILRDVIKAVRRCRPEVMVSFLPLASVIGQSAALLAGVPRRIASLRSPPSTFNSPMRQLDKFFGSVGIYTSILAVSQAVANEVEFYPKRYRQIVSVVRNGVEPVKTKLTTAEARAGLGLPAEGFIALAVGRFAPQKNYRFLLDIAERLQTTRLLCVGDGPEFETIKRAIARRGLADKIFLLGSLPSERLSSVYAAANVFVQPSLYEGQSNTLLEAMSARLPVIVSDVPAQIEVVSEDGKSWGLVLPIDNPEPWAKEIDLLAIDLCRHEKLGALARERANQFTVGSQLDGFEFAFMQTTAPAKSADFNSTPDPDQV